MASSSKWQDFRDRVRSKLGRAIQDVTLARDTCSISPAEVAFCSVSDLLAMIGVRSLSLCGGELRLMFIQDSPVVNKRDYVDLVLSCADACKILDRGLDGRQLGELSQSVLEAVDQLTTWVNQVMCALRRSLTSLPIPGPWLISKGSSSIGVSKKGPFDCSSKRTNLGLPNGGRTSIGSFTFSMCVQSVPPDGC